MSIIDQIRAEVERRKLDGLKHGLTFVPTAMQNLLEFLDTLQEKSEKPINLVCDGLEEEISLWISENENIHHNDRLMVGLLKDVARHFYELGRQSKPKVSEDLETEAKKYADETDHSANYPCCDCLRESFIAGASWQKEQMLKEAVECDVDGYGYLMMDGKRDILVAYPFDFEMPDKVRIVIVKEEGE